MIAPSNRLIWFVAAVILPAAAIGGLVPRTALVCSVLIAAALTAAILDAMFAPHRLSGVQVRLPELVRMTLNRESGFALRIENSPARLRVGLAMPGEFIAKEELLVVDVPSALARVEWFCTPRKRGSYRIERCYFETASALGFWVVRGQTPASCEIRVYPNLSMESRQVAAAFLNRGGAGGHGECRGAESRGWIVHGGGQR